MVNEFFTFFLFLEEAQRKSSGMSPAIWVAIFTPIFVIMVAARKKKNDQDKQGPPPA